MHNHRPPTKSTIANKVNANLRQILWPEGSQWIFCWPETATHQIVPARTEREATLQVGVPALRAIRKPYPGGPCTVCGNKPTIGEILRGP